MRSFSASVAWPYLFPASEKDIVPIDHDIPDSRKNTIPLRKKPFQGSIYQLAIPVWLKIAEVVFAPDVDPVIRPYGTSAHHRLIRKGIILTTSAIKIEMPRVI